VNLAKACFWPESVFWKIDHRIAAHFHSSALDFGFVHRLFRVMQKKVDPDIALLKSAKAHLIFSLISPPKSVFC
jgi:hypothetical protein